MVRALFSVFLSSFPSLPPSLRSCPSLPGFNSGSHLTLPPSLLQVPIYLSEIPNLFRRQVLPVDVALVQVSPPDKHGYCSLGTSVDIMRAGVQCAKHVVGHINSKMPRTLGDGLIHISQFDRVFKYVVFLLFFWGAVFLLLLLCHH